MQLKKAEDSLGQLIFDRSKSPMELTAFGKKLLPIIRDTLSEHKKIEQLVQKTKGTYLEEVRIGIIPTIANYMLPDLFGKWQKDLNDVQLIIEEMKTEEILHAFEEKKLDIGILSGPLSDNRLRIVPLYQEQIKAFYPKGKGDSVLIDELQEAHPWLLTSGNCLRTQMMNFCELRDKGDRAWDYEGGSIDLLENMVRLNGGYTLVPEHYIKRNSKDYRTITSSTGELPAREVIAIASNRSNKWDIVERLIRTVQLKYNKSVEQQQNYKLLNWK
jgi:LysR family hydrogen peroxide-inducible transcriptional activator